jgi:predicted sugar kinase
MEVAERNRLIKKDLAKIFGYKNVSVQGDRGTAYGWIDITIKQPKPHIEECNFNCPICNKKEEEIREQVKEVLKKYENELSYYYDDFGEKRAEVIIRVDFI